LTPWFLEHLGLRDGATRGDVRKAYARLLKAIDQETELEAFQRLRAAYEASLAWVERPREEEEEADSVSDSASDSPSVSESASVSVSESASVSVSDSDSASDSVSASPPAPPPPGAEQLLEAELARPGALASAAAARAMLTRCLDHERLLELEQRHLLEWRVAATLASGWQPGHEHLLPAAVETFEWRIDRHRLDRFGGPGAFLAAALVEESAAQQLGPAQVFLFREASARLRDAREPSARELLRFVPFLAAAAHRFPRLLELILPMPRLREWVERERALPAWRRALGGRQRPAEASPGGSRISAWWLFVLVFLFSNVARLCGDSPRSTSSGPLPVAPLNYAAPEPGAPLRFGGCELGDAPACLLDARAAESAGRTFQAEMLYERACQGRQGEACARLAWAAGGRRDWPTKAAKLGLACEAGHATSCKELGRMYEEGWAVKRDGVRARELYERACAARDVAACGLARRVAGPSR